MSLTESQPNPKIRIYLAPMEGVVDYVIRDLFTEVGGFDQCVTEFVRITTQLLPAKIYYRYCPELLNGGKTRSGVPVFVQLLGSDLNAMAENAALAAELGAPGIDINFGCPAKTVNRRDGGATLLKDPERVFRVAEAVRRAVPRAIPVTAKVRLGFSHKDFCQDIAQAARDAQMTRLTVHARTRDEGYRPPAHWEYIAHMKTATPNFQVVANGDIWTIEDYKRCREISGCQDVALGRSAFARPDLALMIKAEVESQSREPMTFTDLVRKHLPRFVSDSETFRDGDYALSRAKQWIKFLGRSFPDCIPLFEEVKKMRSSHEVKSHLAHQSVL